MGIDGENQKKKRSHNSDYYRIDDMCYEEGFLGEDVYNKAYLMFKDYRDAKFRNDFSVNSNAIPSQIEASKIFVRGTLMDVMSKPFTEAESEQRDLVKEVLSLPEFLLSYPLRILLSICLSSCSMPSSSAGAICGIALVRPPFRRQWPNSSRCVN